MTQYLIKCSFQVMYFILFNLVVKPNFCNILDSDCKMLEKSDENSHRLESHIRNHC